MSENDDILQVVPNEDLPKLRDLYKEQFPQKIYVYNFLNSAIRWKKRRPHENYDTVLAPHGDWRGGTFVAIHECDGYEVFISTLEKNFEKILRKLIVNTKKVQWSKRLCVYDVHEDHKPTILKALSETDFVFARDIPCNVWWMPCEEVLKLDIIGGPEIQIKRLDTSYASLINAYWPHKFLGSERYVSFVIEMNGGYGAFLSESGKLVAWCLRIQIGIGMLQVLDDYKRRGYGSLVTMAMSKEIAQDGVHPLATVLTNNKVAQAMFQKIGFRKSELVSYIESKEVCADGRRVDGMVFKWKL